MLTVLDSEDAALLQSEIAALDENLGEHLPSGIIHADLFKDNVLLNGDEVSGFIDFYYACNGNFMYDLAIAVNDWARTADNKLDPALYDAFIHGYESVRPLSDENARISLLHKERMYSFLGISSARFPFPSIRRNDVY